MRVPRRFLTRASVVLSLALTILLAGCVRVNRAFVLNPDGSGTYTLTIGLQEPHPGDPTSISPQIVTVMNTFGAQVRQQGGTSDRFTDLSYAYWTYTRPFSQVSAANTLLAEGPQQDDPSHTPVLFHDALQVSRETGPDGAGYHVIGTISLADPQGTNTGWRDATESLAITMTSGISAYHGGTLVGDTVTYSIGYNESATVDVLGNVSTRAAPALSSPVRLVMVGVLLALAVTLAGLGGWLLRGARRAPYKGPRMRPL